MIGHGFISGGIADSIFKAFNKLIESKPLKESALAQIIIRDSCRNSSGIKHSLKITGIVIGAVVTSPLILSAVIIGSLFFCIISLKRKIFKIEEKEVLINGFKDKINKGDLSIENLIIERDRRSNSSDTDQTNLMDMGFDNHDIASLASLELNELEELIIYSEKLTSEWS